MRTVVAARAYDGEPTGDGTYTKYPPLLRGEIVSVPESSDTVPGTDDDKHAWYVTIDAPEGNFTHSRVPLELLQAAVVRLEDFVPPRAAAETPWRALQ